MNSIKGSNKKESPLHIRGLYTVVQKAHTHFKQKAQYILLQIPLVKIQNICTPREKNGHRDILQGKFSNWIRGGWGRVSISLNDTIKFSALPLYKVLPLGNKN